MNLSARIATALLFSAAITSFASAKTTSTYRTSNVTSGSYENELTTILTRGSFFSEKNCKDCDTGSALDLSGSYLRTLQDNMQVGGEVRLQSLSKEYTGTGKSATRIDLVGIGVYNFDGDFQNSIYAKAGLGLYSVLKNDGSDYENKLGLFIGAGKRFALFQAVTYSPELRLIKRGDIDFGIEIALINFSIFW